MDLRDFVSQVPGFANFSHPDKIKLLGWYLQTYASRERFDVEAIRDCYRRLDYDIPNLSRDLSRLIERTPPELLKDAGGYRLEARVRAALDAKYGEAQTTIAVNRLLSDLPAKVPGIDERVFLQEVVSCFRAKAFRASIVMAWNLAFDHLLNWILSDASRLAAFNARISVRYPKKTGLIIKSYDDFEDLKESEVIEILNSSGLVGGGVIKVLNKELPRRNLAAHPSGVVILQSQAEDAITDLVNNVVLKL